LSRISRKCEAFFEAERTILKSYPSVGHLWSAEGSLRS
jgi:hypothetical protein